MTEDGSSSGVVVAAVAQRQQLQVESSSNSEDDDNNDDGDGVEDDTMMMVRNNNDDDNDDDDNADNTNNNNNRARILALDALERDAEKAWIDLPDSYRRDKQFILTALRKSSTLPPKSEFERQFPQSLRFDRDVVLAFCARDDFETLYYDRHLYPPECLQNDKEVMIAYCSKIPRSLQECSEELCDDRDVVEAAIALDGLELQYASMRLQEEKNIVVAACQKDGRALEFCPPGNVRNELTSDRSFMLSVLRKHGGPMLRLVSDPLIRRDRELLLEAVAHGMRFRFCPFEFQTDKAFLLETVERKSEVYLEMNRTVQSDVDVARGAIVSGDSTSAVQKRALENVPSLASERSVALAVAKRGDREFCKEFLTGTTTTTAAGNGGGQQQDNNNNNNDIDGNNNNNNNNNARLRFRDDKEIMLAAVERDSKLFPYASDRLREDVDVVLAAMDSSSAADVLRTVSADRQRANPEITIKAIAVGSARCLRVLYPYVPEALWTNRDVAVAWIRRGCRVLEPFERMLATDEEMALELAQYNYHEFHKVGEGLRGDVDFMRRAVDRNGRVLRHAATADIRDNVELCCRAVASHPDALNSPSIRVGKQDLQRYVREKLDLQRAFMHDFLRGIAISAVPRGPPHRRSQLPMLDRGVETSQAFKRLIAEFLGVPVGADLKIMRTAWTNLTEPNRAAAAAASTSSESDAELETRLGLAAAADNVDRWARRRLLRRRALNRERMVQQQQQQFDQAAAAAQPNPRALVAGGGDGDGGAGEQQQQPAAARRQQPRMFAFLDWAGGGGGGANNMGGGGIAAAAAGADRPRAHAAAAAAVAGLPPARAGIAANNNNNGAAVAAAAAALRLDIDEDDVDDHDDDEIIAMMMDQVDHWDELLI